MLLCIRSANDDEGSDAVGNYFENDRTTQTHPRIAKYHNHPCIQCHSPKRPMHKTRAREMPARNTQNTTLLTPY